MLKLGSFDGGVHLPEEGKLLTSAKAVSDAPLLERYFVILHQSIGAPSKPIVKAGDLVKKGQLIAEPGGHVSISMHAPTSGKVADIGNVTGPFGAPMPCAEIEADGKDEWAEGLIALPDWQNEPAAKLLGRYTRRRSSRHGRSRLPVARQTQPAARQSH